MKLKTTLTGTEKSRDPITLVCEVCFKDFTRTFRAVKDALKSPKNLLRTCSKDCRNKLLPDSKYSKEMIEEAVKVSSSIADVVRFFGLDPQRGGSTSHIKNLIVRYGCDYKHFKYSFDAFKVNSYVKSRPNAARLKKEGVPYCCDICNLDLWLGDKITLDVDHIDGDRTNDSLDNLRFLCPNCHRVKTQSHLKTTRELNRKKREERFIPEKAVFTVSCEKCQMVFQVQTKRHNSKCSECIKNSRVSKVTLTKEELEIAINTRSYSEIAREQGVVANTIKKRAQSLGIPLPTKFKRRIILKVPTEELIKMLETTTMKDIAKMYDCDYATLKEALKEKGIDTKVQTIKYKKDHFKISKEELEELITLHGVTRTAEICNTSRHAIRGQCHKYGLGH